MSVKAFLEVEPAGTRSNFDLEDLLKIFEFLKIVEGDTCENLT